MTGLENGENIMIAAGSLVAKDVPARELRFGNPDRSQGKAKTIDAEKD